MPNQDLAFDLAEHAARTPLAAISDAVLDHMSTDHVDSLAAILGGLNAPGVPETRAFIEETVRLGVAVVFGTGLRLPATFAAHANATAGHALDFDDTLDEGGGMHAGVPVHTSDLAIADDPLARQSAIVCAVIFAAALFVVLFPALSERLIRALVPWRGLADRLVRIVEGLRLGFGVLHHPDPVVREG